MSFNRFGAAEGKSELYAGVLGLPKGTSELSAVSGLPREKTSFGRFGIAEKKVTIGIGDCGIGHCFFFNTYLVYSRFYHPVANGVIVVPSFFSGQPLGYTYIAGVFSPLPTSVRAIIFMATTLQPFLPPWTRVESHMG